MKFLSSNDPAIDALFGGISPPAGMNIGGSDPVQGLGKLVAFGINMFIMVAGMFMILYLLLGAFDWITSGGDKDAVGKARNRIINALIGLAVLAIAFALAKVASQFLGFNIENITIPSPNPSAVGL